MKSTKKTAKKTPKKTPLVAGIAPKPAAARRAEALLGEIERRRARIVEDFYDIGAALDEILRKRLYVPLGFDSFAALVEARTQIRRTQAFKLVAIVRHVSREQAIALGAEKAYELVRWTEATPALDSVDEVLAEGLRGPDDHGPVAVETLSSRALAARRRALVASLEPPREEERAARRSARAAQAALRKAGLRGLTVQARRAKGRWEAVVVLPLSGLDPLAAAVTRAAR